MAEMVELDIEPFIRRAMQNVQVEVNRELAFAVAVQMRALGWMCIPPLRKTAGTFEREGKS